MQMDVTGEEDPIRAAVEREVISRSLLQFIKPAIDDLDDAVVCVRQSQLDLRHQIDSLYEDLKKVVEGDTVPIDLEPYVKKLNNSRRRVMLVSSILQNVQGRLNKLQQSISKETAKRKAMLDPVSPAHQK